MGKNFTTVPLDNYNKYLSQITKNSVRFVSAMLGRPIVYCSLKRFDILKSDEGETKIINNVDLSQQENEKLSDFLSRRDSITKKPYKDFLKEIYPDTVNLEPERGLTYKIDELDGLNRVEISEDYDYYKLECNILKSNQNTSYFRMDSTLSIIVPAVEELVYKKNDKVIFNYNDYEYVYTVAESPETYLYDVFQLNLQIINDRPLSK